MANNTDIEQNLVIRAKDLSSETLKTVAATVAALTDKLAHFTEQAKTGEGGTVALTNALKDTREAFSALTAQQSALDRFAASQEKLNAATSKRDDTVQARDDFKATLPAEPKDQTKDQKASLKSLESDVTKAEAAVKKLTDVYEKAAARLKQMGVESGDVAKANETLANSMDAVIRATGQARLAQEGYIAAAKQTKAQNDIEKSDAAELRGNLELEATSRKRMAQIIVEAEQQKAKARADAQNEYLKLTAQYAQEERKSLEEDKKRAQERIELDKFQHLAFTEASKVQANRGSITASPAVSNLTEQLAAIRAPADAARQTLAGVTAEVTSLGEAQQKMKMKTADGLEQIRALALAQSSLARQAGLIDTFRQQQVVTNAAGEAADTLGAKLADLGFKSRGLTTIDKELESEIKTVARDFAMATTAADAQRLKLSELQLALQRSGLDYLNLDKTIGQIVKTSNAAAVAMEKAATVANQSKSTQGGFLGLRQYELVNLSYQVNDVVTGILSGQKASQIAAQQGGQIFQIFEKNMFGLLKQWPLLLAAFAAGTLAIGVFGRALNDASAERSFSARLAATGESAEVTGKKMLELTRDLQRLGVSFNDAEASMKIFLEQGLRVDQFAQAGKAARDMADVFGVKVPEAAKSLAEGVSGGMAAVMQLDKEIHFLTPALFDLIKEQIEAGNAAGAHKIALDAASKSLSDGEKLALSPFAKATRDLTIAWNGFLESIQRSTVIQGAINLVAGLTRGVSALINTITAIDNLELPDGLKQRVAAGKQQGAETQKKELTDRLGKLDGMRDQNDPILQAQRKAIEGQITALDKQIESYKKIAIAQTEVTSGAKEGEKATNRQEVAAHALADAMHDARVAEFRSDLRGPEATKADAERLDQLRKNAYDRVATAKAALTQEVKDEIEAGIKRVDEQQKSQRAGQVTQQSVNTQLEEEQLAYNRRHLKGSAGTAADVADITAKRAKKLQEIAREEHVSLEVAEQRHGVQLNSIMKAQLDDAARLRASQDAKMGDRARSAEESLEKQLLALRAKIGNNDKTDMDRRLKAVDDEFAKFDILLAQMQRKGGRSIGGQSPEEFKAEIEQLKEEQKIKIGLETYEAKMNALIAERKTLNEANNRLVSEGKRDTETGYMEAERIAKRLNPEIKALAQEAEKFARSIGGADPTPKVRAAIAQFKDRGEEPDRDKEGVGANLQAALKRSENEAKTRQEIEKVNRELQKKGLQDIITTEDNVKAAYDRTSKSILAQTADVSKNAAAALKAGHINRDQYEMIIAKVKELRGETEYASKAQQELVQGIEQSVGTHAIEFFDTLAQSIGKVVTGQMKFGEAVQAVGLAFAKFVADVLMDIAKLILKQLILAQISALVNYLSGGTVASAGAPVATAQTAAAVGQSAAVGAVGTSIMSKSAHIGGVVGSLITTRSGVDARMFTNAPRFHAGGIVGLQPDEYPTILKKNEEVLTENDPRNVMNGGRSGSEVTSKTPNIRQVLVMDKSQVSAAMAGSHGEQVVVTHIKNNAGTIRSILRG